MGIDSYVYTRRLKVAVMTAIAKNLYCLTQLMKSDNIIALLIYAEEVKQLDPSMWSLLECLAWRWGLDDPTKILAKIMSVDADAYKFTNLRLK